MKKKLDKVMDKVQVLGDGVPLSYTSFVKFFRYDEASSKLTVFTDFSSLLSGCPSCLVMSVDTEDRVIEDLRAELECTFPDMELVFN